MREQLRLYICYTLLSLCWLKASGQQDTIRLNRTEISKKYYGGYFSLCRSYNAGGIILPPPPIPTALGATVTYTETGITKAMEFGGSLGAEFMSGETWRWFSVFAMGISLYNYKAGETQTTTQYINQFGTSSTSQSNITCLFHYAMMDITFRNYLRIIESRSQRLAAGIGITGGNVILDNNSKDLSANNDIPPLSLFISANIRYDIALHSDKAISFEPYCNYELRSTTKTYPRLASLGLKIALLFN